MVLLSFTTLDLKKPIKRIEILLLFTILEGNSSIITQIMFRWRCDQTVHKKLSCIIIQLHSQTANSSYNENSYHHIIEIELRALRLWRFQQRRTTRRPQTGVPAETYRNVFGY